MRALRVCHLMLAVAVVALALAPAAHAGPLFSHRVVVGFAPGVSAGRGERAVEGHGGRLLKRLGALRGAVVEGRGGLSAKALIRRLRDDSRVRYAEGDY